MHKGYVVFSDSEGRIIAKGHSIVDFKIVGIQQEKETFDFPRGIGGTLEIDTVEGMPDLMENFSEEKVFNRQESFGKFLNKGKRW